MKIQRSAFAGLFTLIVLLCAFLGALVQPPAAHATDLSYSTLPQTGDSDLIIKNKQAVAITALAPGSFRNIATNTTTTVKSGAGVLDKIVINTAGTTSVVTIYDNTAGSGTKIATVSGNAQATLHYNVRFSTGLTIVTTGAPDLTVSYR